MSQKSRPIAPDVFPGPWMPQPVYAQINEDPSSDASKVESSVDPEGDTFEVKLANLAWPRSGPQRLSVRLKKTSADNVAVSIVLLQGSRVIAFKNVTPSQSFQTEVIELTEEEKRSITDYTDLRLKVAAGYSVTVDCCENRLPLVLRVAISSANCACLDGVSMPIVYNGFGIWETEDFQQCSYESTAWFDLKCVDTPARWELSLPTNLCIPSPVGPIGAPNQVTCSPLDMVWNNVPVHDNPGCCGPGKTITVRITE